MKHSVQENLAELVVVRANLSAARKRINNLWGQEAIIVTALAPCSLCKKEIGQACTKPSGGRARPHAERMRAAEALYTTGDK
jgi:hypothetical protein